MIAVFIFSFSFLVFELNSVGTSGRGLTCTGQMVIRRYPVPESILNGILVLNESRTF